MLKKFLLFILLLASFSILVFLYINYSNSIKAIKTVETPQPNPFGTYIGDGISVRKPYDSDAPLSPEIMERFKNNPEGLMIFKYGWGLTPLDSSAEWDYKTVPFVSTVVTADPENNSVEIKFTSPEKMPLLAQTKKVSLANCTPENVYINNGEDKITQGLMAELKGIAPSDDFISFCLDEECNEVGRLCKVIEYLSEDTEPTPSE